MLTIEIISEKLPGYDRPVFSWFCELCPESEVRELKQGYVRLRLRSHTINYHNVEPDFIRVVVKET